MTDTPSTGSETFQARVEPWLLACFGEVIAADREERNHRFIEEALELVQACGCTASECHQLVDYVFRRAVGEPAQEVGGAMVTLAALCLANGLDMHTDSETELSRIWTKVDAIRAKQAAKPAHSPLPEATPSTGSDMVLVPREPTENMLTRGKRQPDDLRLVWRAMVGAAHAPAPVPSNAGEVERDEIVKFLRRQSDLGANRGGEAAKGTTKRAAFAGGSLALALAADAIAAGDHRLNDNDALTTPRVPDEHVHLGGAGLTVTDEQPVDDIPYAGANLQGNLASSICGTTVTGEVEREIAREALADLVAVIDENGVFADEYPRVMEAARAALTTPTKGGDA